MQFIGRDEELSILEKEYHKNYSSFVAIYGRRRVEKTELINHFLMEKDSIFFSVTGAYNVKLESHLANFSNKLSLTFGCNEVTFNTWDRAFQALQYELKSLPAKKHSKMSIFIDELPWLAEMKDNGFKGAISLFWNDFASKRDDIFLIVCGSATSWIINHIIDDHGSLSNRITAQIHLEVFTLNETKQFLEGHGHKGLSPKVVMDYYMVLGGVAHYLKLLDPTLSFVQNIHKLFFKKNGILRTEYSRLFRSLFKNHEVHETIVQHLSSSWGGQSLTDLSKKKGLSKGAGHPT
jgi:AAA+ ATPase superfamily predicted ATPase